MSNASMITRIRDLSNLRALLCAPWTSIEVQSGRIRHPSVAYRGAWSVPSLLIRAATDVLVYAEARDEYGQEQFGLRFGKTDDEWCSSHLRSARPAFAPVLRWPANVVLPIEFSSTGPAEAQVGLGPSIGDATTAANKQAAPILWCCFVSGDNKMMVYADNEIPLNVGIAQTTGSASIQIGNTATVVSIASH